MTQRQPIRFPVTDAAKRRVAEGYSADDIIKISNSTRGRLYTLRKDIGEPKKGQVDTAYLRRSDLQDALENLDRARERLDAADDTRRAAVRARKRAVDTLERRLVALNARSQEMDALQDAITATLAIVPIAVGAVASTPVVLVVGVAAAAGGAVNTAMRAGGVDTEGAIGIGTELVGDGVGMFADEVGAIDEAARAANLPTLAGPNLGVYSGTLTGVGVFAAGVEIFSTSGVNARLEGLTNESFERVRSAIEDAGPIDKDPAREALADARDAQHQVNRAEVAYAQAQIDYVRAVQVAEGVTWVAPKR